MKKYTINNLLSYLLKNKNEFKHYLRLKFLFFHNSNFFHRDFQFGIKGYFEKQGILLSYFDSEKLARLFAEKLIEEKLFIKISDNTYKINNQNYITREPGDPFKDIYLGGN